MVISVIDILVNVYIFINVGIYLVLWFDCYVSWFRLGWFRGVNMIRVRFGFFYLFRYVGG